MIGIERQKRAANFYCMQQRSVNGGGAGRVTGVEFQVSDFRTDTIAVRLKPDLRFAAADQFHHPAVEV